MKNFEELGINKDLVKGLADLNIIRPTEIQEKVIPVLLEGNTDLIGQATTGTGKTAAYGLPLLLKINPDKNEVQALILCPTRELSQQVAKQLFRFTKYYSKIFTESVYGGEYIGKQITSLQRPTHIVVATPGRLIDLLKRKALNLSSVKIIILDEADEMLSRGFKAELEEIMSILPYTKNKWLFSATMPQGIQHIIKRYMSPNAVRIKESGKNVINKKITHQYLICDEQEKLNKLLQFLASEKENRGLVFCRTKGATQKLAKQLIAKNIACDAIHGDLLQKERDKVMRAFKNKTLQFLVATDVAARGIDIEALAFVVHFQLPENDEYYTHRSGRTARAGKEGISLCFVNTPELKVLKNYEQSLNIEFKQITQL
ncbi:MAG: DEAD/DEAH box helicase [Bacteroidales bacterium]|nr:DEAD/DEAH box helicase [Bacteroidales bacterium]MBN2757447.1 DEAD/DEAH box helicase [Bacteroidales bacterium]